jgi:predicted ATP-binding protein involved in virulence
MAKTRSKRSNKNKTIRKKYDIETTVGDCCDATFHGLHEWHKHVFEHLGWMILAKSHGFTDKIAVYKSSLIRLKHAIEEKIKTTREKDRKDDLHILHKNIMTLIEHVEKDF